MYKITSIVFRLFSDCSTKIKQLYSLLHGQILSKSTSVLMISQSRETNCLTRNRRFNLYNYLIIDVIVSLTTDWDRQAEQMQEHL